MIEKGKESGHQFPRAYIDYCWQKYVYNNEVARSCLLWRCNSGSDVTKIIQAMKSQNPEHLKSFGKSQLIARWNRLEPLTPYCPPISLVYITLHSISSHYITLHYYQFILIHIYIVGNGTVLQLAKIIRNCYCYLCAFVDLETNQRFDLNKLYCQYCSNNMCMFHLSDLRPNSFPESSMVDWRKEIDYNLGIKCKACRNPNINLSDVKFYVENFLYLFANDICFYN